jgi:TolA-binding protein
MRKKELLVILILVVLVGLMATVRLFSTPVTTGVTRPDPSKRAVPTPGKLTREQLAEVVNWPRPSERLQPRDPGARRLFDAAETIAAEGLLDDALAVFRRFIEKYHTEPATELALLRICQCYTLASRPKEAAEHYEQFLSRYPGSDLRPMALLWGAESYIRLGETELARKHLNEIVAKHPTSAFAEGAKARLAALDAKAAPQPTPPAAKP